jgi:hypothetical protein
LRLKDRDVPIKVSDDLLVFIYQVPAGEEVGGKRPEMALMMS